MIRKDGKYITERCPTCKKPGYKRQIFNSLWTEEEYLQSFGELEEVEGAPKDAECCVIRPGAQIGSTIKEAKELAIKMDKQIAFRFNGQLVVVNKRSNVDNVFRHWCGKK